VINKSNSNYITQRYLQKVRNIKPNEGKNHEKVINNRA